MLKIVLPSLRNFWELSSQVLILLQLWSHHSNFNLIAGYFPFSVIHVKPARKSISYAVVAVLDPLSTGRVNYFIGYNFNKARFYNNSEIDTRISKQLSIENKAKLSQLTRPDFVTIAKLTHEFQSNYL